MPLAQNRVPSFRGCHRSSPGYSQEDFLRHVRLRGRRIRIRRILRGGTGILVILLVWQIMSQVLDLELILPQPLTVLRNVVRTLTLTEKPWLYGPNIYVHLSHSFLRAMTGFAAAAVLAIPLGLAIGRMTTLREFVMPSIKGIYPIPGIAWIPFAILWFGLGDAAVVFVVFATTFFPLFFNTEAGARMISPTPSVSSSTVTSTNGTAARPLEAAVAVLPDPDSDFVARNQSFDSYGARSPKNRYALSSM